MARRNPPVVPADTSPEIWRMQMDIISRQSGEDRLAIWRAHLVAIAEMEEAGVRHRHPEYDAHDVHLALVRRRYGDEVVRGAWPDEPLRAP